MPIRVACPGCKKTLGVKDHLAGKRVLCPVCKTPLLVPGAVTAAPIPVVKPAVPVAPKKPVPVAQPADMEAYAAESLGAESEKPTPAAPTNGAHVNGNVQADKPPIEFHCLYCDAEIKVPAEQAGKQQPCPECARINKVPLPKEEKPKDWRTVQASGPSAARQNMPEKLDNAWGNENKTRVSQAALAEAGVLVKQSKPSIGLAGWIERVVKVGFVVIVVGGLGYGIFSLRQTQLDKIKVEEAAKAVDPKWSPVLRGEFYRAQGEHFLRQPKQRDAALESFNKAWQEAILAKDAASKIDADLFLISLAESQLGMGGDEMDVRGKDRFDWNQEVFQEMDRTLKRIDSPEAKVMAVRELSALLVEKKKADLIFSLVNSVSSHTDLAKTLKAAHFFSAGKTKEADQTLSFPDPKRGKVDLPSRCAYAEGFVRADKVKEAMSVAQLPGDPRHKFAALVTVAASLAADPKASEKTADIKAACDAATALLDKEIKDRIPAWPHLQLIRLVARAEGEGAAKPLLAKVHPQFKRRAQFEVALAAAEKAPPETNVAPLFSEMDKETRGLAWVQLARARTQSKRPFTFRPDDADDETYRKLIEFVAVPPAP